MERSEPQQIKKNYSLLAKLLHWSFVLIFAYGIYKQVSDVRQLENVSFLRSEIIFALVFLAFLVFRFLYMFKTQSTSLPDNTPKFQKLASKVVHLSMYIGLSGIALSGLLIGYFFSWGIKDNLIMEITIGLHEVFVFITYWLISLHVIAAIYHRFRQDNVWNSMVPFWKEKNECYLEKKK